MTKQAGKAIASFRQAGVQIEITPAMIEAGVTALVEWQNQGQPSWESCVEAIYLLMRRAACPDRT